MMSLDCVTLAWTGLDLLNLSAELSTRRSDLQHLRRRALALMVMLTLI